MDLILSLFPGADLLGRGFEAEGFCVVRGPDLVWGGDVRSFHAPARKFAGVIGGSPCQEFSRERRAAPVTGYGLAMVEEFKRIVSEAAPVWYLLENVAGVPDCRIPGYGFQRFTLRASECGGLQLRLRVFQFGARDGSALVCDRGVTAGKGTASTSADIRARESAMMPAALASEGRHRKRRRALADFCELQGLPRNFDLPGLSLAAKYKAIGNGVPVYVARVVAAAIARRRPAAALRLCPCMCGRELVGRQQSAGPACRKRLQRIRLGCDPRTEYARSSVTIAA